MRGIPSIPGLSKYPELEKRFERRYREISNNASCPKCEVGRLIRVFRAEIEERRKRDN